RRMVALGAYPDPRMILHPRGRERNRGRPRASQASWRRPCRCFKAPATKLIHMSVISDIRKHRQTGALFNLDADQLLAIADALGNPHRLRIVAALASGREYVS